MDHTVLPANNTIYAFTPQPQSITALCVYPRRNGQAELIWVVGKTEINFPHQHPDTVTHPSTNRARRIVTSLI